MKLLKCLKLPTPKELGWSEDNSLGLRYLTPLQEGKTWEDWHEYCSINYPVRYFIFQTLPKFFNPIHHKISSFTYWLECKFIPGVNRYKLDLSEVDPLNPGAYGHLDCYSTVELATWYAFRRLMEGTRRPVDLLNDYTEEELEEDELLFKQQERYLQAVELYDWWMVKRGQQQKEVDKLYTALTESRLKAGEDPSSYQYFRAKWIKETNLLEETQHQKLLQLVDLIRYL
jgi:hypothetical protein